MTYDPWLDPPPSRAGGCLAVFVGAVLGLALVAVVWILAGQALR